MRGKASSAERETMAMGVVRDYVFLHGGGQGGWVWAEAIEALNAQDGAVRAITLDIPGCGAKRGVDASSRSFDEIVEDLALELDRATVADAVLVGHSQAGSVLPSLIRARPSMFARVVYVSCAAPLQGQTIGQLMGAGLRGQDPEQVGWPLDPAQYGIAEQFGAMFCNDMTEAQKASFLSKLGQDVWAPSVGNVVIGPYTPDVGPAAIYVQCLQDNILPPEWQLRFAERLGAKRIVRVDAGHQVMNTRPYALAEILRNEAAGVGADRGL
jgi:pimeloyl-ACP methyl ester carboxylesterase